MKLSELEDGSSAIISKVRGDNAIRKRITEMGFIKGQKVRVIKPAPLNDPVEYDIMGYRISLRNSEARHIDVVSQTDVVPLMPEEPTVMERVLRRVATEHGRVIDVALVGNPNAGKTTLFNFASRSKEHVGNYSGVTVEAKEARFKQADYTFNIIDLPGTYSLTAYSPEELYVRRYITNEMPDVVINVVDASNLERNLYLTTQLIDMDINVIIALNMYDELSRCGDLLNHKKLAELIGIPIVPTVCSKGKGVQELFDQVVAVYSNTDELARQVHIDYGQAIENSIKAIQQVIWEDANLSLEIPSRFLAIKLLEHDEDIYQTLKKYPNYNQIMTERQRQIGKLNKVYKENTETRIADAKYGFIAGALRKNLRKNPKERYLHTQYIDNILTHNIWGFPIFVFVLWLMFQLTFTLGQYPMNLIDGGVGLLSQLLTSYMPNGMLKDLLVDGIIGGVGGVVVFLPNIAILFFFISLMEDTGYMARAAFIMDKLMNKIGLHGKSFIPLIMGFGCNVPAIMSTRTLENRRDRLLTMLINPLMSCSARLPVYLLFVGAFFPQHGSLVLISMYGLGVLLAMAVALVAKRIWRQKKHVPFVMELPPYRVPGIKALLGHVWFKSAQYLHKMGGIILVASILIWALGYFPTQVAMPQHYQAHAAKLENQRKANAINQPDYQKALQQLKQEKQRYKIEHSYIGRAGKVLAPIMKPLGCDWKMTVALITGAAAKEVIISTMGVLYQTNGASGQLSQKLKQARYTSGQKTGKLVFTQATVLGFLVFVLIYFPCIATIAAIHKESGSWQWATFAMVYTSFLAWFLAFVVRQVATLLL